MDLVTTYLLALEARGRSPATIRAARADLRQFQQQDLRRWQRQRQVADGIAPATINCGLSTLRGFCAWAVGRGAMADDPSTAIRDVVTELVGPQALPDLAIDALLRAARNQPQPHKSRDEALLALLVSTGVRAQEACDTQLRDLDLRGGILTVAGFRCTRRPSAWALATFW